MTVTVRYICRECGYRWTRAFKAASFKILGAVHEADRRIEVPRGPCCLEKD